MPDHDATLDALLGATAVVSYCAAEVDRQQDGPLYVWHLYNAWLDAMMRYGKEPLTPALLARWGKLVSPDINARGFRRSEVRVGGRLGTYARDVPAAIETLCQQISEGSVQAPEPGDVYGIALDLIQREDKHPNGVLAAVAYLRFELIHPFGDGNGRTGKILYNWLRGTLHTPQLPPNFFGVRNL